MTPYDLRSAVGFSCLGLSFAAVAAVLQGSARMKKLLLLCGVVLGLTVPVVAQPSWSYSKVQADVTVAAAAVGVFCTIGSSSCSDVQAGNGHVQATLGVCSLTGGNIRVTTDGQTATSSLGTVLTPGVWVFQGTQTMLVANAIRDDSTSGVLSCTVYGQ